MKRHIARDGIPKKQPNKVGTNDTTVPLRTPIPISFQPGLMLVTWNNRMLRADRDMYILWQFVESTFL